MTQVSRMCGGGKPKMPFGLDQWLYGIPAAVLAGGAMYASSKYGFADWQFSAITGAVLVLTMIFKRMGHGQYMNLPFGLGKVTTPESIEFLLKPIFGEDPRTRDSWTKLSYPRREKDIERYGENKLYLRNFTGLGIVGLLPALPLALVLGFVCNLWILALLTLIGGFGKALVYDFSWRLFPSGKADWYIDPEAPDYKYEWKNDWDTATDFGEGLTGTIQAVFLIPLIIVVLGGL